MFKSENCATREFEYATQRKEIKLEKDITDEETPALVYIQNDVPSKLCLACSVLWSTNFYPFGGFLLFFVFVGSAHKHVVKPRNMLCDSRTALVLVVLLAHKDFFFKSKRSTS